MEIVTNTGTTSIANKIKEEVEKQDRSRSDLKRQWLVNVMFLYGKHHFQVSKRYGTGEELLAQRIAWELESFKKANTVRRTSNYILPLFRSLYSRLISMKSNVHAEPTTSTDRDRDAARVSKEVLEDFWENCNRNNPWMAIEYCGMQSILMKLILHKLTLGMAYLVPYFNPKATSYVYDQTTKEVIQADVGEAEVRMSSVMDTFRDSFGRHTIVRRFLCPEQVEYEYGVKVEPDKVDEDTVEDKIKRLLEGEKDDKDLTEGVYVYDKYCIPTAEYPNGRLISCTQKQVFSDAELPSECRKRIPVYEFRYQDLGFSKYGQGAIEPVVDLQQDYNFTLTRIAHLKKNLTGKLLSPRNAKLSQKWDDEVGQIIHYAQGLKPEYMQPASVPAWYYEELKRIREDMENLMNSHDSSMGRTPGQVKSGVGIQNLSDIDNSQIAPELIQFEQKMGFFGESILDICQEKYNERRLLTISGDDLAYEIKSFIGSDLFGQKKILVKMGSNLPTNIKERQSYIIMLRDKGFISSERAKDLLEFGDIDGVYSGLDETAAKNDILNTIEGQMMVIAEPWEDHTIHLKVINDFRKGSVYMKLPPEIKQRIDYLAQQHQGMLLNEMNASKGIGAPMPPAAQPPNQPTGA